MTQGTGLLGNYDHAEKGFLLEEEKLIVRNSGEIPEVAYHGSLYFLTVDQDGPGLTLTEEDYQQLKEQVVARYKEIILRDLNPENRVKSLYRGLARCIANWQRLCRFCEFEGQPIRGLREEIAAALQNFLHQEAADVESGCRKPCINCTQTALDSFVKKMGLNLDELPKSWRQLCEV